MIEVVQSLIRTLAGLPLIDALRARRLSSREHDRERLAEFDLVLSQEAIDNFLNEIGYRQIRDETLRIVFDYRHWRKQIKNRFLDKALGKEQEKLYMALEHLHDLAGSAFAPGRYPDTYVFTPTENPGLCVPDSEGVTQSDKIFSELMEAVAAVDDAYRAFRELAKKKLHM